MKYGPRSAFASVPEIFSSLGNAPTRCVSGPGDAMLRNSITGYAGRARTCRARPCRRRGGEKGDELSAPHVLTSVRRSHLPHRVRNAALCITAKLATDDRAETNSKRAYLVRCTSTLRLLPIAGNGPYGIANAAKVTN